MQILYRLGIGAVSAVVVATGIHVTGWGAVGIYAAITGRPMRVLFQWG